MTLLTIIYHSRYGDGYTVVLKVAGPNPQTEQVSEFIKMVFPNAILKDKHLNMLEYQLPSQGLSVSKLFGQLEANRKIFDIEDYSVSQTTLDQVHDICFWYCCECCL